MTWTTPAIDEIKMDAEIGSYNEDRDPTRDSPDARLTHGRPTLPAHARPSRAVVDYPESLSR